MLGLAFLKNEQYTLHLRRLQMAYRTTNYFSICSTQLEHRSAASFSIGTNGTNRQIVNARPSGVNICSLQMEHRSAASFSISTIGTNGTNRQIVNARPSGRVLIYAVYKWSTDRLSPVPMVPLVPMVPIDK